MNFNSKDHDDSAAKSAAKSRSSPTTEPEAGEKCAADRQSVIELTRDLARLPLDRAAAAVEVSAGIAGVSLRASIEFLRAARDAARILTPAEVRAWGELGRRLAMADVDSGVTFFAAGVEGLRDVPEDSRALLFQICSRQMTLSSGIAGETFRDLPELARSVSNPEMLRSILEIAAEISRRSAKHSAEFLNSTPQVKQSLSRFGDESVVHRSLALMSAFANRAGGIAADAWSALPEALAHLDKNRALRLVEQTNIFLDRGGGAALNVLMAGGEILRAFPEIFDEWIDLLWLMAAHGNASLVAFIRSTPRFIRGFSSEAERQRAIELSRRVLSLTGEIAKIDGEAALACFRSSSHALRTVSIEQFERWVRDGLSRDRGDSRARRSYFALETRGSHDALHSGANGLELESVQHLLRLYVEALTGRPVEVAPLSAVPVESRIGDGHTIHLPSLIAEFGDDDLDFRLYKVLAAHGAGQIEFGTYVRDTPGLRAAYAALTEAYSQDNVDARDAFALDGYINELGKSEAALSPEEEMRRAKAALKKLPADSDYRRVLEVFPHSQLARRIFGTLENGRIDRRLRRQYRGLRRDLDLVRDHLRRNRPRIADLPVALVPFELLFQITLLGGVLDDARQYYGQVTSELETVVADYISSPTASVADTLMGASRVYSLFQSIAPADDAVQQMDMQQESSESEEESMVSSERQQMRRSAPEPQRRDARELFNAWNDPNAEGDPDELEGAEAWLEAETPEMKLEEGEVAYNYDEWDRELTDHRIGWCRVIEKRVKHGDRTFVEQTRERHKGVISSIRYQFQLMKPENLTRIVNEVDGEEYDLNAVIDYVIDRRADGHQSERLYTKRLRRQRDVAVSFLLDQSSSTARTIGRHPLQPYTRPGRRIIEIEKEGLVLMSEALEAVGDVYAINGFTSEGRRNVKFYVVKDFSEKYTDEVKRRIGGITYQNNTRLGAAIRHATAKLARQDARTRLLIVISDGRPYDHDYGDARYAREDTREALRQAKIQGITPFCITIDRESEAELRDLYGEIGYTIIDDVLSLPERLPGIYRRLTT